MTAGGLEDVGLPSAGDSVLDQRVASGLKQGKSVQLGCARPPVR